MQSRTITILRDGLHLAGTIDSPDNTDLQSVKNVAIIMHGFTANKDGVIELACARRLVKEGFACVRFDFNGHGRSEGAFENMTVVNEVEDANAVLSRVRDGSLDLHPQRIFLLGHSQGGVVASLLAGLYPDVIAGLMLLAPAATLVDDAICGQTPDKSYDPLHVPPVQDFGGIPLGGFYIRTAQVLPVYQIASRFHSPVCLVHGSKDVIVGQRVPLRYRFAFKHSEVHILQGADHGFTGKEDEAAACIADFLHRTFQAA